MPRLVCTPLPIFLGDARQRCRCGRIANVAHNGEPICPVHQDPQGIVVDVEAGRDVTTEFPTAEAPYYRARCAQCECPRIDHDPTLQPACLTCPSCSGFRE